MANFKVDILEAVSASGESESDIEAVVIYSLLGYSEDNDSRNLGIEVNTIYSWEEVKSKLDYEYDAGFGWMDCHDIELWTPKFVYYVHEYDGATWLKSVYRNPPKPGESQS